MNILTVIPIYRNKFQNPELYFSSENFLVGSIILIPYSKLKNPRNKNEKPALIIEIENLKNKKQFLRKNDIQINKTTNPYKFILFSSKIIEDIKLKSLKIEKSLEFSLEKLFTKNVIKELNKINENSEKSLIKEHTKKITSDFVSLKLKPFLEEKTKLTTRQGKIKGVQSIGNLLSIKDTCKKSSLHSEKHYLVAEIRKYFNETALKGKGSFSFYLGFFKRIPEAIIYQYWAEVKESRKSIKDQQKIFWWKIGQLSKNKKEGKNN